MRIVVYPASLDVGGSQLNAIEVAAALRDRGHQVWVFGPAGPLCSVIAERGLPFVAAPERYKLRPSPSISAALARLVRDEHVDVVHAYEWPPILDAVYGPFLRRGTAVVGTVMSMGVAPFVPAYLPLTVGTEQIRIAEASHRADVRLLEPPVDTELNRPADDMSQARSLLGVGPDDFAVVVVSRLAHELKREGILEAISAAPDLAQRLPLRLVVVGDGPAGDEVRTAAARANAIAGREIVSCLGSWDDPRPAYAGADLCFGMGSSALRAMAFAKPLIVQGERGYWRVLDEQSLPEFLHQGWYGVGDGTDGSARFADAVLALYADAARRRRIGDFARSVVEDRFSLQHAARLQEQLYLDAVAAGPSRRALAGQLAHTYLAALRYNVRRRIDRLRGTASADDFNALQAQAPAVTHERLAS